MMERRLCKLIRYKLMFICLTKQTFSACMFSSWKQRKHTFILML